MHTGEEGEEEEYEHVIFKIKLDLIYYHPTAIKIYANSSKKEIKILAKTMAAAGQLEPIVINEKNQIVSGTRRVKAAYYLGWTEINAIREFRTGENETVSIVYHNQQRKKKASEIINEAEAILGILGKNQGQRKDLLKDVKDNPFGVIGKDRFEKAANVIGDISASTLRRLMEVVQFEKESAENKSLGLVEKVIRNEIQAGRAHSMMKSFQLEKKQKAEKKGLTIKSTYSKDDFNIYNKSSATMSEVKSNSVQVVFTSPPYYNLRNYGNSAKGKPELGHESSPQEYITFLSNHLRELKRVLKNTGSFFLNIGDTYSNKENLLIPTRLILHLCDKEKWYLVNEIIWRKTNALPQPNTRRLQPTYEKIFHLVKDPIKYYYEEFKMWNEKEVKLISGPGDRTAASTGKKKRGVTLTRSFTKFQDFIDEQNVRNIITGPNAAIRQTELKKLDSSKDHPALMPSYLPIIPILTTTKEGDIVLDPFSGSGTTGNIALSLGRKYVGYELNKASYELSIQDLNKTIKEKGKSAFDLVKPFK